ncbi:MULTISPECIES: GNAT family N-acetyltransferase [Nocardia]|uniref:GNAT family N-acetyltransferase n=1 Tax=Nocardia TaxID=1817 RepID=UPI000D690D62|nr:MULTISPECIES: GNAT family N-acetyltransferase [Nocardia]
MPPRVRAREVREAGEWRAPERPHWHLLAIATTARARGRGHGRALLDYGIACSDTCRLPTHVETTNPANLGFYRAAGYELVAEVELPDTVPRSHVLCRETTARQR